ncbi:hypothetical protein IF188_14535 [Microbacterium sp. NEAU-LLC]|uniref:Uncharacterized protein n=1 Tax=Microbacterium helvum TaxID=2773713 RepID=A0ABR8NQJ0_9MICO|nr:hypothetical protein [Microbacterium helvum]MBD3942910.1 hypothetical protein [Microbacterium helvum]
MSGLAQLFPACNTDDMVEMESVDVSEERVAVGSGVSIPASWTVVLRGEPGVPGEIRVRAAYDPDLGRVVATEVSVARGGAGDEVTSLTLREVRVQAALQVSGLKVSTVSEPDHPICSGGDYIRRMRSRTERDLTASVVDASRTYALAGAINLPPLKAVADSLAISQSTATRLMSRARIEGLAPGLAARDASAAGPTATAPAAGGPTLN